MIARRWHGRVPAAKADEYLKYVTETGIADYRATPGNLGAWLLHRREGDVVHVETSPYGRTRTRSAASPAMTCSRPDITIRTPTSLEFEPEVLHFEAVGEN